MATTDNKLRVPTNCGHRPLKSPSGRDARRTTWQRTL